MLYAALGPHAHYVSTNNIKSIPKKVYHKTLLGVRNERYFSGKLKITHRQGDFFIFKISFKADFFMETVLT